MAVLQNAVLVVRHVDAEVFLIKAVPLARQVVYLELAVHHALFKLVAHHDVQAVGDLVGLGADERRLHLVDGAVEFFLVHVGKLLRKQLLQFWKHRVDKGGTSADDVLIEPALAFVNAHGHAAS